MTDEITRSEFEALKARVARLEEQLEEKDANHSPNQGNALDHRDAAVVAELEHGESYGGLELKRLYKNHTDIRNDKTAKERAKALFQKEIFKNQVYRGE